MWEVLVIKIKKIIFLNLKSILKVMDMIQEVLENGFYDLRRDPEISQSPSGYSFCMYHPFGR